MSKSQSAAQARAAYMAGQLHALERAQAAQQPMISVRGRVRHPQIPWTEGLTLSETIVTAEYHGRQSPRRILVLRADEVFEIKPQELLRGEDFLLEPGDVIEIQ